MAHIYKFSLCFCLTVMLHIFVAATAQAGGFTSATLEMEHQYYLYNIYQSKFLVLESNGSMSLSRTDATLFTVTGTRTAMNLVAKDGRAIMNGSNRASFKSASRTYGTYLYVSTSPNYRGLTFTEGNTVALDEIQLAAASSAPANKEQDRSLWKLVTEKDYKEFMAKKKFTMAALNVDGMPKSISVATFKINLNPDAKEAEGATAIGKKMGTMGYDVIGVSEDFNFHQEILDNCKPAGYDAMTHRGKLAATASAISNYLQQKTLFDTDGLGLFYNTRTATPTNESWTAWNQHYGYTDSGADGLINKGYRYYLITLADGVQIDLYIMHMDAETSEGDIKARETQIVQLRDAILSSNHCRPIIVMGDTNCRYTRDNLKAQFIDAINADPRFECRDPWIEYGRDNKYPSYLPNTYNDITAAEFGYRRGEVVDKLFYINNVNAQVDITAEDYCQDLSFINQAGEPLADHWPCVVTFSYQNKTTGPVDDIKWANDKNPVDCTHMLWNANFDKEGGAGWYNSLNGATKMTSNLNGGLRQNPCAEVYVQSYSGYQTYGTTWEVSQSINVPNGRYLVQCQGFYRVDYSPLSEATVELFANNKAVSLKRMFLDGGNVTEPIGSTKDQGYYFPNSMDEASAFFSRGLYQNSIEVEVTNGMLTLGIRKTNTTKSSSVWTCFDNFRLISLGDGRGDVVKDGIVDKKDVQGLRTILLKGNTKGLNTNAADVNEDGKVTISDMIKIISKLK